MQQLFAMTHDAVMSKLHMDSRGTVVKAIVGLAVAILVAAVIIPVALEEIGGIGDNFDNWGPAGDTLGTLFVTLFPILAIIGLILYITKYR